ncbi:FkbM family methyltransferase [Haladaptatus caseinilyticus]|uniref:FkbM family methyltransferase n=1 Tax=Haladaptatus caseinilyticus TaxID=2993314 RepID=UPI00224AA307|nr:FkbM family methyltransferase [Haladaptatus caseinilyticus]
MSSTNFPVKVLRAGRRVLATPPIQSIINHLGLQSTLSEVYWQLLFRFSGGRYTQQVRDVKLNFYATNADDYRHYRTLVDERPVLDDLLSRLKPEDVFYDIGAYIGSYTCFAAKAISEGQVVTFEPREQKAVQINANLTRNSLHAEIRQEALSNKSGKARFSTDGVAQLSKSGTEQVILKRGDELVEAGEVPPPTVVKIDVEGAEVDTIHGLSETLSRPECRLVYCEVHPTFIGEYNANEDDVRRALTDYGFTVETIHQRGEEYFIRAEK